MAVKRKESTRVSAKTVLSMLDKYFTTMEAHVEVAIESAFLTRGESIAVVKERAYKEGWNACAQAALQGLVKR